MTPLHQVSSDTTNPKPTASVHRGGKYWNLSNVTIEPKGGIGNLMYRFFFDDDNGRQPRAILPVEKRSAIDYQSLNGHDIRITWLGHAAVLIEMDGLRLLTDPAFSKRASPIQWAGPERFHPLPIDIDALPDLDAIIISHDHYDHLDHDSILKLNPKTKRFYTPLGVGHRLIDWGIDNEKVVELDWWQEAKVENTVTLAATPAQHFSGRGLFDRNETLWSSWVIVGNKYRLYFSGDTGMFDGFRQIGERYGPFDYTLMHIGAYAEEWAPMHMNPEEAIEAHALLSGKFFIPIHWGTYRLAFHPWKEPAERLYQRATEMSLHFAIPMAGQWIINPPSTPLTTWWRELE